MKIGDKVRFLNDVGGGVITAFQDKHTVLVSDEDGFEIPTLIKDVVVIDTNDYNIPVKSKTNKHGKVEQTDKPAPTSVKQALAVDDDDPEEEVELTDLEMTYQPMAQERRGAEDLNICLAFVPAKAKKQDVEQIFDAYLVNDCNYYVHFALLTWDDDICALRHDGEIAPNTKLFLEEVTSNHIVEWERITLQLTAYKRDKTFTPKPSMTVALRVDGHKFYKQNCFGISPFFSQPALVFDAVKDDQPVRALMVDADGLREAMQTPLESDSKNASHMYSAERRARKKQLQSEMIVVDLHAEELFDTMVGLTSGDILEYQIKVFRETMDAHIKQKGRKLIFIHGKGDGVLRKALLKDLKRNYPLCSSQDASFQEYGYGATMVTV